jgi:hypothetical protein
MVKLRVHLSLFLMTTRDFEQNPYAMAMPVPQTDKPLFKILRRSNLDAIEIRQLGEVNHRHSSPFGPQRSPRPSPGSNQTSLINPSIQALIPYLIVTAKKQKFSEISERATNFPCSARSTEGTGTFKALKGQARSH